MDMVHVICNKIEKVHVICKYSHKWTRDLHIYQSRTRDLHIYQLRTRDLHIMAHDLIFFGNGMTRAHGHGTRDLPKKSKSTRDLQYK